jgi:hypothetical protein
MVIILGFAGEVAGDEHTDFGKCLLRNSVSERLH